MKMKVLIAASECAPFAKVGGLADVVGSLPKALKKEGVDARVVIPYYGTVQSAKFKIQSCGLKCKVGFGGENEVAVFESALPNSDVPIYFLSNESYLSSGGIYLSKTAFVQSQEEINRFAFFSKAVAEFVKQDIFVPDIVHCHDWHTGLIPGLLRVEDSKSRVGVEDGRSKVEKNRLSTLNFRPPSSIFHPPSSVFTIHNLANQGFADLSLLKNLGSINQTSQLIRWDALDDNLDLMLQGIVNADIISTVSPSYAKEILTPAYGEGLHEILQSRAARLFGVLNGIDYAVWNPATDRSLEFPYDFSADFEAALEQKTKNKLGLQKKLGLEVCASTPLIGMVNRVTEQKGMDILFSGLKDILSFGAQLVILGVGEPKMESFLSSFEASRRQKRDFVFVNNFNDLLAHRIYAAADLFLMPSRFEPCGLVQLIAMRYGALPVVRSTGGLKDTVKDGITGFVFDEYSAEALRQTVETALSLCNLNYPEFRQMIKNAAGEDFSWESSAKEYVRLYGKALEYAK